MKGFCDAVLVVRLGGKEEMMWWDWRSGLVQHCHLL